MYGFRLYGVNGDFSIDQDYKNYHLVDRGLFPTVYDIPFDETADQFVVIRGHTVGGQIRIKYVSRLGAYTYTSSSGYIDAALIKVNPAPSRVDYGLLVYGSDGKIAFDSGLQPAPIAATGLMGPHTVTDGQYSSVSLPSPGTGKDRFVSLQSLGLLFFDSGYNFFWGGVSVQSNGDILLYSDFVGGQPGGSAVYIRQQKSAFFVVDV